MLNVECVMLMSTRIKVADLPADLPKHRAYIHPLSAASPSPSLPQHTLSQPSTSEAGHDQTASSGSISEETRSPLQTLAKSTPPTSKIPRAEDLTASSRHGALQNRIVRSTDHECRSANTSPFLSDGCSASLSAARRTRANPGTSIQCSLAHEAAARRALNLRRCRREKGERPRRAPS